MVARNVIALVVSALAANGVSAQGADLGAVSVEDRIGETRVLADLVEAPTILHFWATWCGPCREELPELEAFAQSEALGERLVLVSVDTARFERVAEFLDDLGVGLESYRQVSGSVGTQFGILGYPSTVVVDASGEVLLRRQGGIDWNDEAETADVIALIDPAG